MLGMDNKKTKITRKFTSIYEIFKEASENNKDFEEIKMRITGKQYSVFLELLERKIDPDERWVAYEQGFNTTDIATALNQTRANVAARLRHQLRNRRKESYQIHRSNRKELVKVRNWYVYVYLSDKAGTYMQAEKYTAKREGSAQYLFRKYKEHGGTKLDRYPIDQRLKIADKKKRTIKKELKTKPFEQVSFQQRINPKNLTRLIQENDWEVVYEKDIGETHYTEKVQKWQDSKRKVNAQQAKKLTKKRELQETKEKDKQTEE